MDYQDEEDKTIPLRTLKDVETEMLAIKTDLAWPKLAYLYIWQMQQHLDEPPLVSTFIRWFCNLPENKLLLEIPNYFLLDWWSH